MKFSTVVASSALMAVASAHTWIFKAYVDGKDQGLGNSAAGYIRTPPNNSPLKNLDDPNFSCNINGDKPVAKTIDVPEGAEVILEWHHNTADAGDDYLDPSHKGPLTAWLAPTASNGKGDVWVKIAEEGFENGKWATDKMIANKGKQTFKIPAGIAPGEYLLRGEIIALHEADGIAPGRGAQFYMECVQIKITGSGTTPLPAGIPIPGFYKTEDPGIHFNLYGKFDTYPIPGPRPFTGGAGGAAPPTPAKPAETPAGTPKPAKNVESTPTPVPGTKDTCNNKAEQPSTPTTMATVTVKATPAPEVNGAAVAKYGQCGGTGFNGGTECEAGSTCTVSNEYYSQCI